MSENGLAGWTIFLDQNDNGTPDNFITIIVAADAPVAIDDFSTAESVLEGTNLAGTLVDVNVVIDITHGQASDLDITLVSPLGTKVLLASGVGEAGNAFPGTTLVGNRELPQPAPISESFPPIKKRPDRKAIAGRTRLLTEREINRPNIYLRRLRSTATHLSTADVASRNGLV